MSQEPGLSSSDAGVHAGHALSGVDLLVGGCVRGGLCGFVLRYRACIVSVIRE